MTIHVHSKCCFKVRFLLLLQMWTFSSVKKSFIAVKFISSVICQIFLIFKFSLRCPHVHESEVNCQNSQRCFYSEFCFTVINVCFFSTSVSSNDVLLLVRKNNETVASSLLLFSPLISKFVVMLFLFFCMRGKFLLCGRFGDWNCLKVVVKDFLFISRGFRFDVNNPNSILIFNS